MLGTPQTEQLNQQPQLPCNSEVFGSARQSTGPTILRQTGRKLKSCQPDNVSHIFEEVRGFFFGFSGADWESNVLPTLLAFDHADRARTFHHMATRRLVGQRDAWIVGWHSG
jgi:hypothetical protein